MFTLRCTAKLLKRARKSVVTEASRATTRTGDWYAHILFSRPVHLVLCVSEVTLLPAILPARDVGSLPGRLGPAVAEVLSALGVAPALIQTELAAMAEWEVDKTRNRSVLGTIGDFVHLIGARKREWASLIELSLWLAEVPCSPLKMKSPAEATMALFAASSVHARNGDDGGE